MKNPLKKNDKEAENPFFLLLQKISYFCQLGQKYIILFFAAAAVAQSVNHPELRSLTEVQLNWCEFESWSWHKVVGKKILAAPSVGQYMELSARFGKNRSKNMIIFSPLF